MVRKIGRIDNFINTIIGEEDSALQKITEIYNSDWKKRFKALTVNNSRLWIIALSAAGLSCETPDNYKVLGGGTRADINDYWAETTSATLRPEGSVNNVVFVGAMHWNDVSDCGTKPGEPEFLGSGWATFFEADIPLFRLRVHSGSEFPMPPECPIQAGDPKVATDGTNIFYAQMCRTNPPAGSFPGEGLVVAVSSNGGQSFDTVCLICMGDDCGVPTTSVRLVDAPDFHYDPVPGALYLAWSSVDMGLGFDEGEIYFKKNFTAFDPNDPEEWCKGWGPVRLVSNWSGGAGEKYAPAITTARIGGDSQLVIAYHTKFLNRDKTEIHVAVERGPGDPPYHAPFDITRIDRVGYSMRVAEGKIFQPPRPDIVSRDDSRALVVVYPAFNNIMNANEVRTQISEDGGQSWQKTDLSNAVANGHDRFFPALAANSLRVAITYYETTATGNSLTVWTSGLENGRNNWSRPIQLTTESFQPCLLSSLNYYGHYISIAPGKRFWNFWADSRSGLKTEVWTLYAPVR